MKLLFVILIFLIACPPLVRGQQYQTIDLKPLLQKWLKGERLPSGFVSLQTFKRAQRNDDWEAIVKLTFLDLNKDGTPEMAVQSGCSFVGNCDLRIFERRGRYYRKVVSTSIVQTIDSLRTRRRGHVDLKFGTHNSAYDTDYRVFRFDGVQYRLDSCWNENWAVLDTEGKLRLLRKPRVSRGCS